MIKSDHYVLLYTENEPFGGITGFVKCLRREPEEKDMVVNVYKDGEWGTYRYLLLDHNAEVKVEQAYVNILEQGNLSSLRWIECPLHYESNHLADHQEKQLVKTLLGNPKDKIDNNEKSGIYKISCKDCQIKSIHHQCAQVMDPSMRIVLERTVECIFDAGIHPTDLKSSRTGVFAAICKLDTKMGHLEGGIYQK
ncbi:hypothetical protein NQ318_012343 [Aromia moschata]|uniref:Beta-ketoacyl synthase-like N-terminal domain-containing protein n=1 Tax=Aromia moschata TaxID=1265417 RepID=A0AAV8WZP4_9CUCU|nr:hypothetical protein NQ318_012343 [Aromia moschata]